MSVLTRPAEQSSTARIIPDQRRYKRVSLLLLARYMRENKSEFPCRLSSISVSGAEVSSSELPTEGEHLVIYSEHLGGLDCIVQRVTPTGFTVAYRITRRRQQKLAAQLTWLLNQHEIGSTEQRRVGHDRINLGRRPITVTLADGTTIKCGAIDVSVSGAGLASDVRPEIGSEVKVGKLRARVARHHDRGFGVEFLHLQELPMLRRHFG